jgi:hypothetical protein
MQDELDKNLQTLFREQSQGLPEEPFFGNMVILIKRQHSRRIFRQRLILILGFVCCVFLSPLLIKASILLSGGLNGIFMAAGNILDTPAGSLFAVLCALLLLLFMRRRIFRFVQTV